MFRDRCALTIKSILLLFVLTYTFGIRHNGGPPSSPTPLHSVVRFLKNPSAAWRSVFESCRPIRGLEWYVGRIHICVYCNNAAEASFSGRLPPAG